MRSSLTPTNFVVTTFAFDIVAHDSYTSWIANSRSGRLLTFFIHTELRVILYERDDFLILTCWENYCQGEDCHGSGKNN